MWGRKLCVSTMSQIAWWSYSANRVILFWFFLGILKHDGRRVACVEMCWINWNSVSTCVDVPAGWSHRLRLSGYQLLPAATRKSRNDPAAVGAEMTQVLPRWCDGSTATITIPTAASIWDFWDHLGSPGARWVSWAYCQAVAGRSFLWNAALQSLHLGPGGWWIIEIGKPWNTTNFY